MFYTYIVECSDKTLYCGYTTNLEHRINAHNKGEGAKYTRPRRPVRLVYFEEYAERAQALRREAAIKKLTRRQKLMLIEEKKK